MDNESQCSNVELEIVANRIFGPPAPPAADAIDLAFDWIPSVVEGRITFRVIILRGELRSASEFEIDLGRLDHDELERLHGILSRRHASTDTGPAVAASVAWLLERSLAQTTTLDLTQRHAAVRELLLIDQRKETTSEEI